MLQRVYTYAFTKSDPRDKTFLGERAPIRYCRFCGKSAPEVTFKQEKHVIPAAFGNRTLFSWEECDGCNADGSVLENDLANFLAVERAMARMRSRKGSVKYRQPGRRSYIESSVDSNVVTVSRDVDENVIDVRPVDEQSFQMIVETPPFRPVNVAKALGRMALFALDRAAIANWNHVLQWVRGQQAWLPVVHRAFIPGPGLRTVGLEVLRDDATGVLIVVFWFSTSMLFLRLPAAPWALPDEIVLPAIPVSPYPPHHAKLTDMRIVHDVVIPKGTATIGVAYAAVHPVQPDDAQPPGAAPPVQGGASNVAGGDAAVVAGDPPQVDQQDAAAEGSPDPGAPQGSS